MLAGWATRSTIAYCRIGERSAHTWFVLHELLGLANVKNYDGPPRHRWPGRGPCRGPCGRPATGALDHAGIDQVQACEEAADGPN
jgi:hypothetical protein